MGLQRHHSSFQVSYTFPASAASPLRPPARPEGYSQPCPFKGAEPGLRYFRPKPTWRDLGIEGVKARRAPIKKMATP